MYWICFAQRKGFVSYLTRRRGCGRVRPPQANKCKLGRALMDDQARPVQVGLTQLSLFLPRSFQFLFSFKPIGFLLFFYLTSSVNISLAIHFFFHFFSQPTHDHHHLRMRESNFAFPAQNRAAVCISSQLYDRRGAPFRALSSFLSSG
jgi:hypothetical protein